MAGFATYQGDKFRPYYLSVWELVSLGWLYYPFISLVLVSFSLWIAAQSVHSGVQDAKVALVDACGASEKAATIAANIPRYIAPSGVQGLKANIMDSISASHAALDATVVAAEGVVNFLLNLVNTQWLCLAVFVIRCASAVLTQIVNLVNDFFSVTLGPIADAIQVAIDAATGLVNGAIDILNGLITVADLFPGISIDHISPVSVNFNVSVIRDFDIPTTISDALTALNNSIPSINQLQQDITAPLETVRSEMRTTFASITVPNVDINIPPVQNVEFCSYVNTQFLDEIGSDLTTRAHIGIGALLALAVLIFIINAILTWRSGKHVSRRIGVISEKNMADHKRHFTWDDASIVADANTETTISIIQLTPEALLSLDNALHNPLPYRILALIQRFRSKSLSDINQGRLIWFLSYIFSPYPLTCLLVGLFGIIAIIIQLIAVKSIQQKVGQQAGQTFDLIFTTIRAHINESLGSESEQYSNNLNAGLSNIEDELNAALSGWISNSTASIGNAINGTFTDLQNTIQTIFGQSLFSDILDNLLQCVIGGQTAALNGTAEYLHSHIHFPIPLISPGVLLLSNDTLNEVTQPIADATLGGAHGGIYSALFHLYSEALDDMLLIFGAVLSIWGLVVLVGLSIVWHNISRLRRHAETPEIEPPNHRKWPTDDTVVDQSPPAPTRPLNSPHFSTDRTLFSGSPSTQIIEENRGRFVSQWDERNASTTTARRTPGQMVSDGVIEVHDIDALSYVSGRSRRPYAL